MVYIVERFNSFPRDFMLHPRSVSCLACTYSTYSASLCDSIKDCQHLFSSMSVCGSHTRGGTVPLPTKKQTISIYRHADSHILTSASNTNTNKLSHKQQSLYPQMSIVTAGYYIGSPCRVRSCFSSFSLSSRMAFSASKISLSRCSFVQPWHLMALKPNNDKVIFLLCQLHIYIYA